MLPRPNPSLSLPVCPQGRNVHLLTDHQPAHLTGALTQVGDCVQLVSRGFTMFSCYTSCAAALVSAAFGKPHTPQ